MKRLSFTDYEAFSEAIQEASLTMRMTSLEEFKWTLSYAQVGSVRLQLGYEGGGTVAEGVTVSDAWTLYHQPQPIHVNGQLATEEKVFAAPPNAEFCLACHPRHEWLVVVIPTPLLFQAAAELEFASSAKPQLLTPPRYLTHRFTSLARRFLASAELRPQLLSSPVAVKSFQNELLVTAKELFASCQYSKNRHFLRWRGHTKTMIQLAMSYPDQLPPLSELARQTGVPERTLRTAFQSCYGLAPKELIRILRLNQARQLLLESSPDQTTVTQIAFEFGFWDLGRFAGTYRKLFGELPSETLRKPVRDIHRNFLNRNLTGEEKDDRSSKLAGSPD